MAIRIIIILFVLIGFSTPFQAGEVDLMQQGLAFGIAKPKIKPAYAQMRKSAPDQITEELPHETSVTITQWEERSTSVLQSGETPSEITAISKDQPALIASWKEPTPYEAEPEWEERDDVEDIPPRKNDERWIEVPLPPSVMQARDYRLHVGDSLILSLYGEPKTERTVTVDPSGCISYLHVDGMPASGKTLLDLRRDLEVQLKKYFRRVMLSITPVKFNAEFYTVMGQVRSPGKQAVVGNPTLLKALCQAQGFNLIDYREQMWDMCDLDKAFIARRGGYIPVDFTRLVKEGDLRENIQLQGGDFIYLPQRTVNQVFVLGEVRNQRSIDYFDQISLLEALSDAGSITDRASSRVAVLRGALSCPVIFLVEHERIAKGRSPNFLLQPGDIVYVPPRKLYLVRDILQSAVAAFVFSVSYEAGLEWFMRADPQSRRIFGDGSWIP